tara:strand:+ start:14243 stop:14941 length:699 start_codon:yes stop_codon:yes gene_type:complete
MAKIQDRLNILKPYIVGIRYLEGIQIVDAMFKEGWTVPDSDIIKKELVDEPKNYYMFYSQDNDNVTVDTLLDYVEAIININIERENKFQLLKVKVDELKELFKTNELNKLETLRFTFSDGDSINPKISELDINLNESDVVEQSVEIVEQEDVSEQESLISEDDKFDGFTNGGVGVLNSSNVRTATYKNQTIELPPKGNIEVETYDLPHEMTTGPCECGPEEACGKCMNEKGF